MDSFTEIIKKQTEDILNYDLKNKEFFLYLINIEKKIILDMNVKELEKRMISKKDEIDLNKSSISFLQNILNEL